MSKINELMEQFAGEVDGFIASSIYDPTSGQGIISKSTIDGFDPDIADAYTSEIIKENEKALKALKANAKTIDFLITTNKIFLITRSIEGSKFYHGCAFQKTGNLGMTREVMKKYEPRFVVELKKL
jgi:hypothetical protein